MPLIDMVDPPLTTVHVGHTAMGKAAAQLLFEQIAIPDLPPVLRLAPAELIIRASTSTPP